VISPADRQVALQILRSEHFKPIAANHLIERALEAGGFLDPFRANSPSLNKRFPSSTGSQLALALERTDDFPSILEFGNALLEELDAHLTTLRQP
jgi:hypothetical protein